MNITQYTNNNFSKIFKLNFKSLVNAHYYEESIGYLNFNNYNFKILKIYSKVDNFYSFSISFEDERILYLVYKPNLQGNFFLSKKDFHDPEWSDIFLKKLNNSIK